MVGVTDNEHFGKIRVLGLGELSGLDGLGLQEGKGGEAPAGAAAVLVLDGGDGIFLHRGELEIFRLEFGGRLGLGQGGAKACERGSEDDLNGFHICLHCILSISRSAAKNLPCKKQM